MIRRSPSNHRRSSLLAAAIALAIPACSDPNDAFGKRHPVSGQVTYNGQPLAKGAITFVPETGAGATGIIENGSYALSTEGDRDGALPGRYKVTVSAKEDSEALARAEFAKVSKRPASEITTVPRDFLANAAAAAKNLIPAGYGDVRTTTLTAEVKAGSNRISFDLTDAAAPPEPPKSNAARGRGRR